MKDLSESRILIVDDDRVSIDILVEALRQDYKLNVTLNGQSALGSIEMAAPDLILLDIMMPGIDGYEVCRKLRANPATREIPILFLSGLEQVEAKARGFEVGGNDYVTKPFEILEVQARVRSLLKAKAYTDALKEKWTSELRIAHEIQQGLLPANLGTNIREAGLDVAGVLQPAMGVGGDFYDVLRTASGSVLFVVGDVSGKGIPAAMLMAVTLTVVRMLAAQSQQPDVILRWVNDALAVHGTKGMGVTLCCGVYNPGDGQLTFSSAGHPPLAVRRDGRTILWPQEPSRGVGSPAGFELAQGSVTLRPGDAVLFYTNGLTEAQNPDGTAFGDDRLIAQLDRGSNLTAEETAAGILTTLKHHQGDRPPSDDLALLVVNRLA